VALPIRLEECKAVKWHDPAEALGGDLEDALGVVLSLKGAGNIDEESGEAPIVGRGDTRNRQRCHLDRRTEGVATFPEDADLAPLEPCDRHHLVHGLGDTRLDDEGMCEVRADAVLDSEVRDGRRDRLAVDAASHDPAPEPGDEDHRRREMGFGHLVLMQPGGHGRVEKDEVRSDVGDEPPIQRGREQPVDRQQKAELAKLEEAPNPGVVEVGLVLAVNDPGELARMHGVPPHQRRDIEVVRCKDLSVERDEEHRRTGVLRQRQCPGDDRVGRHAGWARQRLIPQIDPVDEVDHRLQRHTRAPDIGGRVGRGASHHCGFQAVPHIASLTAPFPVVHVTPSHRPSDESVSLTVPISRQERTAAGQMSAAVHELAPMLTWGARGSAAHPVACP
jgi:hypothetical protein